MRQSLAAKPMPFDDIHPRFAGYDRYFEQELHPALARLEAQRQEA
ncbi:MAG: hypothetical protein ACREDZ_02065 [Kiloniellales bacterium]